MASEESGMGIDRGQPGCGKHQAELGGCSHHGMPERIVRSRLALTKDEFEHQRWDVRGRPQLGGTEMARSRPSGP